VTPAHDKNDFDIGERHGLAVVNIMNPDATISDAGGPYAGMDRFEARKRIVADLEAQGLIEKVEPYRVNVPISSRSKEVIEPLISRQWFVRMEPLAAPAVEAVRSGQITFYPKRWENEYFRWLENIRDWCISRQLWWGHRIPVWYHTHPDGSIDEGRDFVVSVDQPAPGMVQDEDVLDTWFSSWLWPFATLGWPDDDEEVRRDLAYFYPTDVLVSGYDILFFWIARMIMAGLHFMGEIPYRDIFITGMIKDKLGRWMSKSLGNGIDPLEMIEQYGADAVRFSLTILCAQGQDIRLDPTKFEMGRNFANKIWNAFNVFGQFMDTDAEGRPVRDYRRSRSFEELDLVERWMLTRLNQTIEALEEDIARYRLNEALTRIYALFWGDYCDWYLELIKPAYGETMDDEKIALAVEIYERLIQLLHPFMPFITEDLWWRLRPRAEGEACIASAWPRPNAAEEDPAAAEVFSLMQELISGIRNVKSQYGVGPGKEVAATVNLTGRAAGLTGIMEANAEYFARLTRATDLTVGTGLPKPKASASVVVGQSEVFVPLAGMIDLGVERERLQKEIDQKEQFLAGVERKLHNEQFVTRAPADVVNREHEKARDIKAELKRLHANLEDLG
jgi:valyl-tRNA synthetase